MRDIRQTSKYSNYLGKIGWHIEKTGNFLSYVRKLPLLGGFVKIQRPEEIDSEAIDYVRKKHKAFQVVIEPKSEDQGKKIREKGYKISKNPYLPSKTLHLDLTRSHNELYKSMEKDARYSLRKTKMVKVYEVERAWEFRNAWRLAVPLARHVPSIDHLEELQKSFREDALFLVTPGGESGSIFLHAGDHAYYWQAFSNKHGREGLYQYKIVWTGINWAKEKGAKVFDFEGIYDERFPNRKWKGFTHFKKSFGGTEVEYPGAFVKILLPFMK